ncbi:ABC transporter ATP-binding protein [Phreatobacter stygius]|uniref:Spermidine/putrescine import ATP-binding protein PotA n=1 Tax=Phreatobacter stygius TaxID=1940610 RepID=A0A4D7B9T6_9HYPH|nr:ABC transporter ATP-binding protein [Phreatobacter stygius]QCI66276.1 ABC transporter ATP-binding protein [Phreatobacter stygius]
MTSAVQIGHDLNIDSLSKFYGGFTALDNVSLEVKRGEFLTLLGPSGSGKTTLLMSIAGFVQPDRGDILLDQRSIAHLPPERRNFGMVFQGYALFPHMSVYDNVAFPLKVRKRPVAEIKDKVDAALDLVQLASRADRYPSQLSGGQQQRVALARAMVFTPHLLLLDEPLSALDKKLRAELQEELKRLHKRVGLTFIYVTHDQDEALSMSDRIVVMRDGKVVQQGAPGALYDRPATSFVADFLGKSNFLRGTVETHTAEGFVLTRQGVRIAQASAAGERPPIGQEVVIALRPEKITVATGGRPHDNALKGIVSEWNYFGSQFRLVVDTLEFGAIAVVIPTWKYGEPPAAGQPVTIGWDRGAGTLVDDA